MNKASALGAIACLFQASWLCAASGMVDLPGGATRVGSNHGPADERPAHTVPVAPFAMDRSPVTVAEFSRFIEQSRYRTTAESLGTGAVMSFGTGRWSLLKGANWQHPQGPAQARAPEDHPVTQVSWDDAKAYCSWAGKRLPTEYEWEHAARAGQDGRAVYAFGDRLLKEGQYLANVWTGIFPVINTGKDGYQLTSPVGQFGVAPSGLTDMAGNVWEWVDADYLPYPHQSPETRPASEKVQRGGSYLCDPSFCHGFRASARGHSTPDSALMHVGFRCARDLPNQEPS